jgi:hypothetical protein
MLDFILFLLVFVVLIRVVAIVAMMWKVNGTDILPYIILLFVLILMASCSKEDINLSPCLDENCEVFYEIDSKVSPGVYQDTNGYWHVKHRGLNYFTIKGELSQLKPEYVVNKIPLVETIFDSDYWVWFDNITFTVPLYSVLGFFSNNNFNTPIPVGNLNYTISNMAETHPPLNIVGYQINKNQCMNCPYSPTLIGTYSKYTYKPKQQIFFSRQMVGDTAKVFVKTVFNSDIGDRVEIEKEFKIIFE